MGLGASHVGSRSEINFNNAVYMVFYWLGRAMRQWFSFKL